MFLATRLLSDIDDILQILVTFKSLINESAEEGGEAGGEEAEGEQRKGCNYRCVNRGQAPCTNLPWHNS